MALDALSTNVSSESLKVAGIIFSMALFQMYFIVLFIKIHICQERDNLHFYLKA